MKKFNAIYRQGLESYLRQKKVTNISQISREMGFSAPTLYKEIKLGLSEEDYENRRYYNYSAEKAQEKLILKKIESVE